jgi:6-phosphogluconolactonase
MASTLHSFASAADLADSLADKVAKTLSAAIAARGTASIAVSGGSTPKVFFQILSTHDIAWEKVTITLVDERFVPADNARSNHLLVDANLLQNKAKAARFVPLYQPAASVEEAARLATVKSAEIGIPFDVGSNLAKALDASTPRGIITMEAEGAGEPRLTFTFSSLQDAALLVLHIEGEGKKDVLAKAEGSGDEAEMPIRAILRRATSPVEIYWAP